MKFMRGLLIRFFHFSFSSFYISIIICICSLFGKYAQCPCVFVVRSSGFWYMCVSVCVCECSDAMIALSSTGQSRRNVCNNANAWHRIQMANQFKTQRVFNVDETRSREKGNAQSTKRKDILPHSFLLHMHGRRWQDLQENCERTNAEKKQENGGTSGGLCDEECSINEKFKCKSE